MSAGVVIDRPSFESIYMRLALDIARRSTCTRLSVGCVITSADYQRVLAVGYNGNAAGLPNRCDYSDISPCGDLHAELNAALKCSSRGPKIVFVTHMPCKNCAKILVNLRGVKTVYYAMHYRSLDGADVLAATGIRVTQLSLD